MKQFLRTPLLLPLAMAGSMLIAQDDPDAKQQPEKGQAEQNSQRVSVGKIVSRTTASTCSWMLQVQFINSMIKPLRRSLLERWSRFQVQ